MRTRAFSGRVLAIFVPFALGATGAACSDTFDTSRTLPPRGTLGTELYGVVCDRAGGQSLHEDLTGASYKGICHPDASGNFSSTVDQTQLPPMLDGQLDVDGNPVPLAKQQADRAYGVARLQTLAQHRADLIAAFDATFPDIQIPIKDVDNPDPTQSCNPPAASGEGRLHDELTNLLARFQALYNDGTIPQSTESLARVIDAFKASTDAQTAWAHFDARAGYRPIDHRPRRGAADHRVPEPARLLERHARAPLGRLAAVPARTRSTTRTATASPSRARPTRSSRSS